MQRLNLADVKNIWLTTPESNVKRIRVPRKKKGKKNEKLRWQVCPSLKTFENHCARRLFVVREFIFQFKVSHILFLASPCLQCFIFFKISMKYCALSRYTENVTAGLHQTVQRSETCPGDATGNQVIWYFKSFVLIRKRGNKDRCAANTDGPSAEALADQDAIPPPRAAHDACQCERMTEKRQLQTYTQNE